MSEPRFSPSFYRTAAVCSWISALTTLLLIFLPEFYQPGSGFEDRMARVHDPAYEVRSWVYFVHPFLVFTGALAVSMRIRHTSPALALVGAIGFALWASTEAAQQTLTLFAFDRWREAYVSGDAEVVALMPVLTMWYDGIWDSMYVLLLVGFAIGNLALGVALLRPRSFTRIVGGFLLAAFALTLTILLTELGGPSLPDVIGQWAYPAIQPFGRFLIGAWLWRHALESSTETVDTV